MGYGVPRITVIMASLLLAVQVAGAEVPPPDSTTARQEAERLARLPPVTPHGRASIDRSGRAEKGRASYYAAHFARKKMANGRRMDPNARTAASKTLPLGTTAKVVNTANGREAVVQVEDRGPFVDGRVVDVTPRVAKELDIGTNGVAPVIVKPIAVPQPSGQVTLGAGAADASPEEIRQATETTRELASAQGTPATR